MKKGNYIMAVLLAVSAVVAGAVNCFAQSQAERDQVTGPGVSIIEYKEEAAAKDQGQTGAVQGGGIIPENLEAAQEADQMIVVVGTGRCNADVFYYQKAQDESWNLVWQEAGIVGRNGITSEKAEGDGSTPSGTYSFTLAFGLKEDPGTSLPYHSILEGDYWVDDPASVHYNQLVNTAQTAVDWSSAENMAACAPFYNYGLALNYNSDCIPGKGSAIFLHCYTASPDNGSAGCIRLPEERMRELLQKMTSKSRIVIAEDLESLK